MPLIRRWRSLLVPLALALYALILLLGNIRGLGQALAPDTSDKTLHLLAYGTLAGLLFVGMRQPLLRRSLMVVAVIGLLGVGDECLQAFIPYRDADALDWLADITGAALVCALLSLISILMPARWRPPAAPGTAAARSAASESPTARQTPPVR